MRDVILHIARWVAWHTDGTAFGESAPSAAQITIVTSAAESASGSGG